MPSNGLERPFRRGLWALGAWLLALTSAGCQSASPAAGEAGVAAQLERRIGQTLPAGAPLGEFVLPPGAAFEDGLTEDEAVAIALWNNAAFQETLVDLGVARGDLIQAGLLPNPEFVYFFGVTDKPFKYAFDLPLEALWLRPIRLRTAARDADRAAERLTQAGLDLMRDTRQAFADVLLAKERLRVAEEAKRLRGGVAELAEKRLKAGDISAQEAATARIDALQAAQDAARIGYETPIAEERLRNLLGLGARRPPLELDAAPPAPHGRLDSEALAEEAAADRPDARAAAEGVAAAAARLEFAKLGWVRLFGIADATSGANGHEFGPALRFTLPLFHWNQGNIARAEAELERAARNQRTVANQILLDVRRAALQHEQARAELAFLLEKVRPEVDAAIRRAKKAYEEGAVTYLIVLETTRQLVDNDFRAAQLQADLRRAWAELERSVGRKLAEPSAPAPPPAAAELQSSP